jgi:hypothetical protein
MVFISHRGNINGKIEGRENKPVYIDLAISQGFDVEIDVWVTNNQIWLGHDNPQYIIDFKWIEDRKTKLWIHCKNIESLFYFKSVKNSINYFWHQNDDVTITSLGYFWTYPGKQLTENSIAVMPEISEFDNIESCFGICSDLIQKFKYPNS